MNYYVLRRVVIGQLSLVLSMVIGDAMRVDVAGSCLRRRRFRTPYHSAIIDRRSLVDSQDEGLSSEPSVEAIDGRESPLPM